MQICYIWKLFHLFRFIISLASAGISKDLFIRNRNISLFCHNLQIDFGLDNLNIGRIRKLLQELNCVTYRITNSINIQAPINRPTNID